MAKRRSDDYALPIRSDMASMKASFSRLHPPRTPAIGEQKGKQEANDQQGR
jgi:hypothetical protein